MKKVSLLLLVLLGFQVAHAEERALVIMKSKANFMSLHTSFKKNGQFAFRVSPMTLGLSAVGSVGANQNFQTEPTLKLEDSLVNLNAVVVSASSKSELDALRANPEVAYVEKEIFHPLPAPFQGRKLQLKNSFIVNGFLSADEIGGSVPSVEQYQQGARTPWGILAVKAPQAWKQVGAKMGSAGAGAKVGILDTGIDKDHPAVSANIADAKDFVGDNNTPYEYADKVGHGTHVAGTIAGIYNPQTGFSGVAPLAKLYIGRVCSDRGCSNIAIAKGINWAVSQKVDVISMSLGGQFSTPAEKDAIAKADKAGVTVVAASGNDGTNRVSYPAALPTVIAVGAVDSSLKKAQFSQYGPELAVVAPGVDVVSSVPMGTGREAQVTLIQKGISTEVNATTFEGAREINGSEQAVLVDVGFGKADEFAKVDAKGKYALVQRGDIKIMEKIQNAVTAGASGIILVNNAPGLLRGALTADGSHLPVAVFMIEQTVGEKLKAELSGGAVVSAKLATVASDYSSFDGTSMATPHVSGVVALMKAANKGLTPSQVKDILKRTATALGPNDQNQLGAGIVDAEKAVSSAL